MFKDTIYVCSRCGRASEERPCHGWLIATHRDAEKAFHGEMVIRCPDCLTEYAIRQAEGGRKSIRL